MFEMKKKTILVSFLTFLIIILSSYFIFFRQTRFNCSNENVATWNTGAESVPEYLNFTKNLEKLTDYLGCKCANHPFCYSCRYDSNNSTYIYYYDDKFIVPPYEYIISEEDIKKQNLSINEKGFNFLFNSKNINLNLIKDGKINEIVSSDGTKTLKIDSISKIQTGNYSQEGTKDRLIDYLEFKIVGDDKKYKITREIDNHEEECGEIGGADWESMDKDAKNEMIHEMYRCRTGKPLWKYEVYIYQEGMDFSNYRIDFIMDEIYFKGRKNVLKNLNAVEKFENQLFDIYLKTLATIPNEDRTIESNLLTTKNLIKDIYKIMGKEVKNDKIGVFVYKNNFLVGVYGGEYYGIQIYSLNGDSKGLYCENNWAIGGGGDTNLKCKIPEDAIRVNEYIKLIKDKCNQ